jgi:stearoyl-CoA desaturase (delta-9 desaturase)
MSADDNYGILATEKPPRPPPTFSTGNYKINWVSCAVLLLPAIMLIGAIAYGVEYPRNTMILTVFIYLFNGLGITVGYHRLFSHRAFQAHWMVQAITAFAGAGAFEGSVKWWGRNHRIHHRYIDTDMDPYNAKRGFFFSHMGWMIMKQDYGILGRVDISDFHRNPIVMFQHRFYFPIAMISGILLPTLIAGLGWGDWLGGYFYAGLAKVVFVHQTTFCINSLAHSSLFGAQQGYSENHTSHDSLVCAFVTLGEGYHNFHHEFANDYRNGIKWYHLDPSKWIIRALEMCGLAWSLVRTPNDVIERNVSEIKRRRYQEALRLIEKRIQQLNVQPSESLSWADIAERVAKGQMLTVIGDYVIDLSKTVPIGKGYTHKNKNIVWLDSHPGGRSVLKAYVGKDATLAFSGEVYRHSEGAMNILPHLRIASLRRE